MIVSGYHLGISLFMMWASGFALSEVTNRVMFIRNIDLLTICLTILGLVCLIYPFVVLITFIEE